MTITRETIELRCEDCDRERLVTVGAAESLEAKSGGWVVAERPTWIRGRALDAPDVYPALCPTCAFDRETAIAAMQRKAVA